jgi:hypothetical protein
VQYDETAAGTFRGSVFPEKASVVRSPTFILFRRDKGAGTDWSLSQGLGGGKARARSATGGKSRFVCRAPHLGVNEYTPLGGKAAQWRSRRLRQLGKSSQPIETKWADLAPVGKIAA